MRYLIFATGPQGLGRRGGELRQRLALLLSGEVRSRVEIYPCESYAELLGAVKRGTVSLAWLPPAIYVDAAEDGSAELLLRCLRRGAEGYRGVVFTTTSSPVRELRALAGRRMGWVDPASCSGHLYPRAALAEAGFDVDADLAEQCFLGSHAAVARAVAAGEVDAGATFVHVDDDDRVVTAGWDAVDPKGFRRLLTSDPVPSDTICATRSLPAELHDTVRQVLSRLGEDEESRDLLAGLFQCVGFAPAAPDTYESVRRVRKRVQGE